MSWKVEMKGSPWQKAADRAQAREEKREAVFRAAAQAFTEKGFHNTSLEEVAQRLNITKPTLYYYVKSKDDILAECVRIGIASMEQAAAEGIGNGRETGFQRLTNVMRKYAEIATQDYGRCIILVGEDDLSAESRQKVRALKKKIDRTFRQCVEDAVADGSLAPCDPKYAGFVIAGALSWIARWYQANGPLTAEQVANSCIEILVGGLAPRGKQT